MGVRSQLKNNLKVTNALPADRPVIKVGFSNIVCKEVLNNTNPYFFYDQITHINYQAGSGVFRVTWHWSEKKLLVQNSYYSDVNESRAGND